MNTNYHMVFNDLRSVEFHLSGEIDLFCKFLIISVY